MDLFLSGKTGRVAKVERDFEGRVYMAVTIDEAAEVQDAYPRFFYFDPEELESLKEE